MFIPAVCVILASIPSAYGGAGWTYSGPLGPNQWHTEYPDCGRRMQSPINVDTLDALYDANLMGFDLHQYACRNCTMELENKGGHTAEVKFGGEPIVIKGGSLPDEYVLDQFHFHWGKENNEGSEHMIDNAYAPMEMHIVHHMKGITTNVAEHPYGLAVLGFFFKIGEHNEKFDNLLEHFDNITYRDSKIEIEPFGLLDLLPEKATIFYRYYGSLTTPPCYETVIWTLFDQRIEISQEQLNVFRTLKSVEEGGGQESAISRNDRPVQELHERRVTTNNVKSSLIFSAISDSSKNISHAMEDLRGEVKQLQDLHADMSEVKDLNKEMKDLQADIRVDLQALHGLHDNLTMLRSLQGDMLALQDSLDKASNHADARAVTSLALVTSLAVFVIGLRQKM